GKRVGNGDASLTMYGASTTPNLHKLALQFGVLDNFFDSGEVSGDGHVWSNAAIGTDYLEKTWQQAYRGSERTYDFEGAVANGYPLAQKIADVNEPASGYLWGDLAAHHKTYYHFGEYISTIFCTDEVAAHPPVNPQEGPMMAGKACDRKSIAPGEVIPEEWGGGTNKWPWSIPRIASNTATKPELVGHFATEAPDFELSVPDQIRVDIFLRHLKGWLTDRQQGRDTMPNFVMLRLGNDHTAGTRPGGPTPKASVADNDLAVGRAVEAISHSPFWDDTAFFILEDDAQNGADHVDAHRSLGLVVSKYAPHGVDGAAFVDSRFYSTVSMIRTMETVLGLPPMNNNDALSSMISSLFTGPGDQVAFAADVSNRDNGLIYTANKGSAPGAQESLKMDFRHADRADTQKLNVILWKDAMGDRPVPGILKVRVKKTQKADDDD
ncbi:MAG TPA: phosphoesterase, partial [Terracidiphilus sp.]